MTVWMALIFLVFLSLYLACAESVRKQFLRQQAEQAVEAGMFSLFSEFEPHLLEQYDLFYLDTSFQSGTEKADELRSHLWRFLEDNTENMDGLELQGVDLGDFVRATDASGAVFYQQAIRVMKEKTGFSLAEDWLFQESVKETMEDSKRYQEDYEAYRGSVRDYDNEEEELDPEAYEWDGLQDSFICSMAVPKGYSISEKQMDSTRAPSKRELSIGAGQAEGNEERLLEKQWFISYLDEYLAQAAQMLPEERADGYLDYQLEYVLCGKPSDQENLEGAIGRLLLLREGCNYAFLLSHSDMARQAELLSAVLAALVQSPELSEALKHLILLGWAYGESLVEVRQLLGGYELEALKTEEDWQVPLLGTLSLLGDSGQYDEQPRRQQGLSYGAYLRVFLSFESAETLAMRSLDIIEGELQSLEGCSRIHMDHCVEKMGAQVWFPDIFLEREYGYE